MKKNEHCFSRAKSRAGSREDSSVNFSTVAFIHLGKRNIKRARWSERESEKRKGVRKKWKKNTKKTERRGREAERTEEKERKKIAEGESFGREGRWGKSIGNRRADSLQFPSLSRFFSYSLSLFLALSLFIYFSLFRMLLVAWLVHPTWASPESSFSLSSFRRKNNLTRIPPRSFFNPGKYTTFAMRRPPNCMSSCPCFPLPFISLPPFNDHNDFRCLDFFLFFLLCLLNFL